MSNPVHPRGTVRRLLATDAVTPATAKALIERLRPRATAPLFFDTYAYHILSVVCDLLLDQPAGYRIVPVAAFIDERLAAGRSGGWRFDHMPPDDQMYRQGLDGIDETARAMFSESFALLSAEKQQAILQAVQAGSAAGMIWQQMSSVTFFEELLAEATEIFYAHPLAQEEIGYNGMADAFGWEKIGLNEGEDQSQVNNEHHA